MGWPPAQAETDHSNVPFFQGDAKGMIDQTIKQDAGRTIPLAPNTLLAQIAASEKWVPLTDVDPALTAAKLVCGANGGNLAAWQAINDGEFSITVDGEVLDIIGLDTSGIAALTEIVDLLQNLVLGKFIVFYDVLNDTFRFLSTKLGTESTITVLSAVAGGAGTDISGAAGLNGAAAVGTATQGTGGDEDLPSGIYRGSAITAAAIVAGDVTGNDIIVGGPIIIDETGLVIENSLTLGDVVVKTGKTIRATLIALGLNPRPSVDVDANV